MHRGYSATVTGNSPKSDSGLEDTPNGRLAAGNAELVAAAAAIVSNDAEAIGRYMSDDRAIVGPDGTVIDRARFLAVIESGKLHHHSMRSDDWRVRVYGDTAVVTAQTWSEAEYMGQVSSTRERSL